MDINKQRQELKMDPSYDKREMEEQVLTLEKILISKFSLILQFYVSTSML